MSPQKASATGGVTERNHTHSEINMLQRYYLPQGEEEACVLRGSARSPRLPSGADDGSPPAKLLKPLVIIWPNEAKFAAPSRPTSPHSA
jgi:hypothetical protein